MPRNTISPALQTQFGAAVTSLFYLVQINGTQIIRWSNGGDCTVLGVPWSDMDFEIDKIEWNGGVAISGRIRAQNLDNALGALFLNEPMSDVIIDVYQVERAVLDDPQHLGSFAMDDTTINLETLEATLLNAQSSNAKSPRRRVDAYNGFFHALPKGTKIVWGTETFILEPFNG